MDSIQNIRGKGIVSRTRGVVDRIQNNWNWIEPGISGLESIYCSIQSNRDEGIASCTTRFGVSIQNNRK
jgi:hypothetical protein